MKCVIFGGAEICRPDRIKRYIPEEDIFVIAADRGLLHCEQFGIKPDIIMGDFDSLGEIPEGSNVLLAPSDKDDTDMLLAVKYAAGKGISREFVIFGGTGGRMGHTIANVQTLSYISSIGLRGCIVGDTMLMRTLIPSDGRVTLTAAPDTGYISLFSLSENAEIVIDGLKYSGRISLTRTFPLGVSNEPAGKSWSAEVLSGEVLLIEEYM